MSSSKELNFSASIANARLTIRDEAICIHTSSEESGITISQYHNQDCCERVYADFDAMLPYRTQIEELPTIDNIRIKPEPDMGFTIFFESKFASNESALADALSKLLGEEADEEDEEYKTKLGVFIPCYNIQNGYYNDELSLTVKDATREEVIDLTDMTASQ